MTFLLSMLMMPLAAFRNPVHTVEKPAEPAGRDPGADWMELADIAAANPECRWYYERARLP